ncbi:MAG: hypothetical protein ACD_75C01256G0001 [uncultured bacterium]|nr:MAG: hypothetical protein ACD_75C01256G0001 [uncultured bacterium]
MLGTVLVRGFSQQSMKTVGMPTIAIFAISSAIPSYLLLIIHKGKITASGFRAITCSTLKVPWA